MHKQLSQNEFEKSDDDQILQEDDLDHSSV